MTGTIALFLREVDLTKEQRDILDKAMHRFDYSKRISIPDHPSRKDWNLPQYTYYNPEGGRTPEEHYQIRDAIRAEIPGFFTIILLSRGSWTVGWFSEKQEGQEGK